VIKAIRSVPHLDLVLIYLRLTDIEGFEFTKIIRKIKPGLSFVAQKVCLFCKNTEKTMESEFWIIISKTFNIKELLDYVEKASLKA